MMCMEVPWCATCQIYADGDVTLCTGCRSFYGCKTPPLKYKPIKKEEKKMVVTIIGSLTKKKGNGCS